MINLKTNIMCKICRKVLKDPVNLPCECVACLEHIVEITKDSNNNQNNQMMCPICNKVSYMPKDGVFSENLLTRRLIDTNVYLTPEEKLVKNHFETCFNEFAELFTELELKETELEACQRDHFVELQKKLDLTRDSLKLKIDKIVKDFYF
jgi:hypothetical protein